MGNNEARATRVDVCTSIKELKGRLEAIKNDDGLAEGIQVHHLFWDFI